MAPVVNRLDEEFGEAVLFLRYDARDGEAGERAFSALQLPGHPGFLLYAEGREVYRAFGLVEEAALRAAITAQVES